MLYIVEYLHLVICQNLLIRLLSLHILKKMKILKVLYSILKFSNFQLFSIITNFVILIDYQDSQLVD